MRKPWAAKQGPEKKTVHPCNLWRGFPQKGMNGFTPIPQSTNRKTKDREMKSHHSAKNLTASLSLALLAAFSGSAKAETTVTFKSEQKSTIKVCA